MAEEMQVCNMPWSERGCGEKGGWDPRLPRLHRNINVVQKLKARRRSISQGSSWDKGS